MVDSELEKQNRSLKTLFSRKLAILLIIAALIAFAVIFFWYQTTQAAIGTLQVYEGEAEVVRNGQMLNSKTGTKLKISDSVKVKPNARVAIVLKGGNVIRLEAGSEVLISNLEYQGQSIGSATLILKTGRLWSRVGSVSSEGKSEVETPTSVASVRGTSFNVDYIDQVSTFYSSINQIEYSLLNMRGTKILPEGNWIMLKDESLIEDFENTEPTFPPEEFFDDWVLFNEQQDEKLCEEDSSTPGCQYKRNPTRQTSSMEDTNMDMQMDSDTQNGTVMGQMDQNTVQKITTAPTPTPTPTTNPTTPPHLLSVIVSADPNSAVGQQAVVKAIAKYSNFPEQDVTTKATWHQDPQLGIFSDNYYKPEKTGTVTIYAEYLGKKSNEVKININEPKTLSELRISHSKFDCQKNTSQFTATALFSDNSTQDVTNSTSWSLNTPTYSKIDSKGLYTAGDVSKDTVVAVYQDKTTEATIIPYQDCTYLQ